MRRTNQASGYLLTVFLALFAGQAFSETQTRAWDSTIVQQLSDDLFVAAQRLVVQCRTSPSNFMAGEDGGTHMEFRYHVRHFRALAVDLSTAIEDSQGIERTRPIYNEMIDVMEDLEEYAIGNPRGAWGKVEGAVKEARKYLRELEVYYEE
jgi:hypothetical protein